MKSAVPALAPLLRSNTQGEILATLFLNPDEEFSLSDLSRLTDAFPSTVHREVERLTKSDIVRDRMRGRSRLVHANIDHELASSLSHMLLLSYGPRVVLEPLVEGLPGMQEAFIYGSWAVRYGGEQGPPPQDIDVLIVGSTPRERLIEIGRDAQSRLRKEVNMTRVTTAEWESASTPFVTTVREQPLVSLMRERAR